MVWASASRSAPSTEGGTQLVGILQLFIGPFLNSTKNFLLTTEGSKAVMCSLPGPQGSFLRPGSKPLPLQLPEHRLDGPLDSTHRIPPHYHNKKYGKKSPLQACGLRVNASWAALTFIAFSLGCSRQFAALITQHPSFQSQSFSKTSKSLSALAISAISAPGGTVNSLPPFQIQWMS